MSFQRDCEERAKRDVELQMNHFRENSAVKIRLEEAQKARLSIESVRKELEGEYARRLENHLNREAEMTKRLAEQERQFNQSQYEARQVMQREIDELRNREQLAARKVEMESQGLKLLELRLKEAQSVLESRERELATREKRAAEKDAASADLARREARELVRGEMDQLAKDRTMMAMEWQRLHDERANHISLVESAGLLRSQLRAAQDLLTNKEEEIASLKRAADRVQHQRLEEEQHLSQALSA